MRHSWACKKSASVPGKGGYADTCSMSAMHTYVSSLERSCCIISGASSDHVCCTEANHNTYLKQRCQLCSTAVHGSFGKADTCNQLDVHSMTRGSSSTLRQAPRQPVCSRPCTTAECVGIVEGATLQSPTSAHSLCSHHSFNMTEARMQQSIAVQHCLLDSKYVRAVLREAVKRQTYRALSRAAPAAQPHSPSYKLTAFITHLPEHPAF